MSETGPPFRQGADDFTDPADAERLAFEHPDEYLRRREFLGRTAALAGLAGAASVLPASTLVAEAARVQGRARMPAADQMPLDTIVVLMMENRSFDHYFGWHPKADARNEGLTYLDGKGATVKTHRLTPDFQGCGHPDPDHSWDGGRFQLNGGKMDGFAKGDAKGTGSDEFAVGYYLKEDLGFIPHAADAFTLYDHYHTSLMASTWPNREYMWSAQSGGNRNNTPPVSDAGFQWETIFDRAQSKGVSVGYYGSDLPFAAVWGPRGVPWARKVEQFYTDAAAGTLPNIVFVDPPFKDGGGGDGLSADEHPHGDVRLGQAFMSDVVHAFIESPQYRRGALFINYDEWGGFFDHVVPPIVPDDRASRDINENYGLMGFRIPAVCVSPFARGGRVSHPTLGHESILKLMSYRWNLGYLNRRHRYAYNIGRTLNWSATDFDPPSLPDPAAIVAVPCRLGGTPTGQAQAAKHSEMAWMEESGYLERLGYEVGEPTYESLFRSPDRVRRAHESSR